MNAKAVRPAHRVRMSAAGNVYPIRVSQTPGGQVLYYPTLRIVDPAKILPLDYTLPPTVLNRFQSFGPRRCHTSSVTLKVGHFRHSRVSHCEAQPGRRYYLRVEPAEKDVTVFARVRRELYRVASENFGTLLQYASDVRHGAYSRAGNFYMVYDEIFRPTDDALMAAAHDEAGLGGTTCDAITERFKDDMYGILERMRPGVNRLPIISVDDIVEAQMEGYASLLDLVADQHLDRARILAKFGRTQVAGQLERAVLGMRNEIAAAETALDDIGMIKARERIELARIFEKVFDRDPDVRDCVRGIDEWGRLHVEVSVDLLVRALLEAYNNAFRAATDSRGDFDPKAIDIRALVLPGNKRVRIIIDNEVNDEEARAFLRQEGILRNVYDRVSGGRRQAVFVPGVTSRSAEETTADSGGMGLATLLDFMQAMNGRAIARSNEDGTRFRLMLDVPCVIKPRLSRPPQSV